jgi:hypothetical protein
MEYSKFLGDEKFLFAKLLDAVVVIGWFCGYLIEITCFERSIK